MKNKLPQSTAASPPSDSSGKKAMATRIVPLLLWKLFIGAVILLVFNWGSMPNYEWGGWLRFNGFTLLIATTVTFFGAIVSSYAHNYLTGFRYRSKFMWLSLGFTFSVILLVISDHILLFIGSWFLMGVAMASLIGIDADWGEAREAAKLTQRYFLLSTAFLSIGFLALVLDTQQWTLSGLAAVANEISWPLISIAALFFIAAAMVQSAIYPFHRWLLSAMTAPTPASALMHAGFVNGGGILLALIASIMVASETLTLLFIIGGLTAVIAQFTKLLQVNVKQKLGCSTMAQMGFMIMQCGLGFFNAAVVHLILHGFYKAYLFLSSGEAVEQTKPQKAPQLKIRPLQALAVLLFGGIGAYLFALWTGKGMTMDSGIFLTLIVAITVGQATYNIVKERSLTSFQKVAAPIVLFVSGIGIYSLLYNGVTQLMASLPMAYSPMPLSYTQIIFGLLFLLGFFIMKLGVYKKLPWLYVKLMNLSQPHHKTVLMYKSRNK